MTAMVVRPLFCAFVVFTSLVACAESLVATAGEATPDALKLPDDLTATLFAAAPVGMPAPEFAGSSIRYESTGVVAAICPFNFPLSRSPGRKPRRAPPSCALARALARARAPYSRTASPPPSPSPQ